MRLVALVIGGYLLGATPFGVLVSRLLGKPDPRRGGSGNIGATNVARLSGRAAGVATLLLDLGKGYLPTLLASHWLPAGQAVLVGLAAFAGHVWPVYLRFKGGKGVATALGVYLALAPWAFLGSLAAFGAGVWLSGHVSVGSLAAAGSAPLWMLVLGQPLPHALACLLLGGLVAWRHRDNLARLRRGAEPGLPDN